MSRSKKHFREKIGRFITILKRGRTYYAEVYVNGQQSRQSLGTRNLKAARERALDIDAKLQRGEMTEKPVRISVKQATEGYLAYVTSESRRPKTLAKYSSVLGSILEFTSSQGVIYLDQINLLLAEKYRAHLRTAGYADNTIAARTTLLKMLTKWAVERDLLVKDPLTRFKGNKAKPSRQPCFTLDQVDMILSVAQGQQKAILGVLAFTGMRIGELQWLAWDNVDLDNGFIQVRPKDDWIPKHGRSRTIPIHDRVREVLQHLPTKHRWVFTARKSEKYPKGGNQINPGHILERLKKVLSKLGLQGHLHTFRHFFASHCANNGVPPFQLIKWLGHADVGMVMHYYELHDEQSLWTMKKLSQVGSKKTESRVGDLQAEVV